MALPGSHEPFYDALRMPESERQALLSMLESRAAQARAWETESTWSSCRPAGFGSSGRRPPPRLSPLVQRRRRQEREPRLAGMDQRAI